MKKLLLLSCLALTAFGAWAQDEEEVTEYQVILDANHGDTWRAGAINNSASAAAKWVSNVEGVPQVTFAEKDNRNNLAFVKNIGNDAAGFGEIDGNLLSLFCASVNYTAYASEGWYVSKIAFDVVANYPGVTLAVNRQNYAISQNYSNTFEFEYSFGDDIVLNLTRTGSERKFVALSNCVITLKKITKDDLLSPALAKYNFEMYPQFWSAESAQEANEAISSKYNELIDNDSYNFNQIYDEMIAVADNWYDKLCREEMHGKYFTFQNRDTGRYLAVGQNEETGDFESQSIDDGNDQHAIWYIGYDDEYNKFRLHNYETDYDLMNTNNLETRIPVAAHEDMNDDAPGALFSILPVRIKENGEYVYIVEFMDAVENGNYHYIHDSTGNGKTYPVKWHDAEGSIGSGWFVSLKEVNPDGDLAGLIAHDKTDVVVYNLTQEKYLTSLGNGQIGYSETLEPRGVWRYLKHLDGHEDENFALYNEIEKKYAVDLVKPLSATRNSNLKVDNVEGKFETWHIFNRGTTSTGADEFVITSFNNEYQDIIMSELKSKYAYDMGDEPGMYNFGDDAKEQAYTQVKETLSEILTEDGFNLELAQAAFDFEMASAPTIFDLNNIEGAALIRIKTVPENNQADIAYFSNTNYTNASDGNAVAFNNSSDANENENTIFVLHEGKLSSYIGGRYIHTTASHVAIRIWETDNIADNEGLVMNFIDGSHKVVGGYVLNYDTYMNGGTETKAYVFSDGIGANRGSATAAQGWLAQLDKQSNWYGYYFNVEYVKTLNVAVEGDYKLWHTPVAVTFGANSGAYVVSVNKNQIKTEAVNASTIYGAGTTFVLTQSVTVNVENGSAVEAVAGGLGHHATKTHTLLAGKVYLTINDAPEVEPALYYDYYETSGNGITVPMKVIVPEEDTEMTLPAHTPLIEAEQSPEKPLVDGGVMDITLGETHTTTSISELNAETAAPAAVYDLQGRRLAAPARGINIINGRKHLVK